MKYEQFTYWLQGYCEARENNKPPTKQEWEVINEHLNLCFHKEFRNDGEWEKKAVGGGGC